MLLQQGSRLAAVCVVLFTLTACTLPSWLGGSKPSPSPSVAVIVAKQPNLLADGSCFSGLQGSPPTVVAVVVPCGSADDHYKVRGRVSMFDSPLYEGGADLHRITESSQAACDAGTGLSSRRYDGFLGPSEATWNHGAVKDILCIDSNEPLPSNFY